MSYKCGQWIRPEKRLAIYLRDGLRCAFCGATIEEGAVMTLDHLLASELGGSNQKKNLVTACLSCNSSKQNKTIREWFQVLRDRGIDTEKIGQRIRRLIRKELKRYKAAAKDILEERKKGEAYAIR